MSALRCLILSLMVCMAGPAFACMPCLSRSSLDQTIEQSDVIALLRNDDRASANYTNDHPESMELTVLKVYKGDVDTSSVLVRSWYGDCAYGIQLPFKSEALVFLQEAHDISSGLFDGTYKLVEDGCSEGQILVHNNSLLFNNKWVPLSSFVGTHIK